jgi:hypothetical protein
MDWKVMNCWSASSLHRRELEHVELESDPQQNAPFEPATAEAIEHALHVFEEIIKLTRAL